MLMTLFGKMVSPEIAKTIWIQRGDFLEGQRPRPQRLTATLLFTDMKDFTTACEQMDPTDVTDWLNEYMEIMSKQVLDRGGIINEYIGDSIMATFGIPVPRATKEEIDDDAVRAVQSAVAMAEELDKLNDRWKAVGKRTTAMRVGIFTGPVVTGSLGSTERMKYSVVGDTVNTAARLQSFDRSINDPDSPHPDCRVLVGDPTWQRLAGKFHGKKVGEFDLKGKKERVTIWQVFKGKT
jgi:class 3 adenylate cyclase